ncbi:MAG: protein kinase [bacterium]
MKLEPDMIISQRYKILHTIGVGGTSNVYCAMDLKLERKVTFKVLKEEFIDEEFIAKFDKEARAAARITHINIASVYDVGNDGDIYYIVMEYVEGYNLKQIIKNKPQFPNDEILIISMQIANALEVAHNASIVHRDIKPQNILVTEDGEIKVTDFGIARISTSNTITVETMGSAHYFSPEQARGAYVDARTDIYSLGIVMFEMVTGELPFQGDGVVQLAMQHINNDVPNMKALNQNVTTSIEKIILKATAKSADRRYSSAKELREDIKKALSDESGKFVEDQVVDEESPTVVIKPQELEEINSRLYNSQNTNNTNNSINNTNNYNTNNRTNSNNYDDDDYNNSYQKYDVENLDETIKIDEATRNAMLHNRNTKASKGSKTNNYSQENNYNQENQDDFGEVNNKNNNNNNNNKKDNKDKKSLLDKFDNDKKIVLLAVTTSIIIIITVTIIIFYKIFGSSAGNTMPDFTNKTWEEALVLAQAAEVYITPIDEAYSTTIKEGCIMTQSVQYGLKAERGENVEVVLSLGSNKFNIDNFVGFDITDVYSKIQNMNINIKEEYIYDQDTQMGEVIKQLPVGGSNMNIGDTLTLYVSRGEETEDITVPNLIGYTEQSARATLITEGLSIGSVTTSYSNSIEAGKVISQSINFGNEVPPNTRISIVVSIGKQPVTTTRQTTTQTQTTTQSTTQSTTIEYTTQPTTIYFEATQVVTQQPTTNVIYTEPNTQYTTLSLEEFFQTTTKNDYNNNNNYNNNVYEPTTQYTTQYTTEFITQATTQFNTDFMTQETTQFNTDFITQATTQFVPSPTEVVTMPLIEYTTIATTEFIPQITTQYVPETFIEFTTIATTEFIPQTTTQFEIITQATTQEVITQIPTIAPVVVETTTEAPFIPVVPDIQIVP